MSEEAMLGCLERMIETCLEMKAELEQERERREKKRDERKEAKERRDKEEVKKAKEPTPSSKNAGAGAGAGACVYAYGTHPTLADVETHCVLKHIDKAYARKWLDFIESEGWHFSGGALVTRYNFRTSFNAWYRRELRLERKAAFAASASSTPAKSWKEREFEAREAEIKRRREEADREAREEGLRILGEMKRNGGL